MKLVNKIHFERWVLDCLSSKSSRHLFFNFNERLIVDLLDLYSQSGSLKFLPDNYFCWVFTPGVSDDNYFQKQKMSRINDSDLIEIRNLSEENAFIVFVSNASPVIIPSDNITSVSEKYFDSRIISR